MTSLPIDIRDARLKSGRLTISSRTTKAVEFRRREAAVRKLLDRGDIEIIERLRARELRIEDIERAVREDKIDDLRRTNAEPMTLGAVLDRTLQTVNATLETGTQRAYVTLDRMLRAWKGPDYDIRQLTKDEAEQWLFAPKPSNGDEPWGASRQLTMATLAGRVWNDAIEREVEAAEVAGAKPRITRNPWKAVETKAIRKGRAAYLQPEQWRALLDCVRGTPKALPFGLGVLAGLRRGEICHLRRDLDIDLQKGLLKVQPREGEFAWRPKTDRSIRDLDIEQDLRQLIDEHYSAGYANGLYVVRPDIADRPLAGGSLRKWAKEGFEAAGLKYGIEGEGLTMHSTRHTFASWGVQNGISPMVMAILLGDTVAMVIEVYGHLAPRNYREAMQTIGAVSAGRK